MTRSTITSDNGGVHFGYGALLDPDTVDELIAQHNEHATALDTLEGASGSGITSLGPTSQTVPSSGTLDKFDVNEYTDWDPWAGGTPNHVLRVIPHPDGTVLHGLKLGNRATLGAENHGYILVIMNQGGTNTQNSGNLILAQDTPGNDFSFHTVGRRPYTVIPSLGCAVLRMDETNKWFVLSVNGVTDMARVCTTTVAAASTLTNWDPVDDTSGLTFRVSTHMKMIPGAGCTLQSMKMDGPALGASAPGSSYGQIYTITNFGSALTVKHLTGASGVQFALPGGVDATLSTFGSMTFWHDDGGHFFVVTSLT